MQFHVLTPTIIKCINLIISCVCFIYFVCTSPIIVIMHFVYHKHVLNIITCCMHRTTSSGNNNGNVQNQVIGAQSPGNNPQLAVFRIYISCVILTMSFMHFTCTNPYHPMLSISNFN